MTTNAEPSGQQAEIDARARQVRQQIVTEIVPDQADDERSYRFIDAETERSFEIRRSTGFDASVKRFLERFFMSEYVPNGRIAFEMANGETSYRAEPLVTDSETSFGPNALKFALRAQGIDTSRLVEVGGGYSIDSVYHESLDHCATAIAEALVRDQRYDSYRELSDQEQILQHRSQAEATLSYWKSEQAGAHAAHSEQGIFQGCYSGNGPLADKYKREILSYLNAPTQAAWLEVRGLEVAGHASLWQAWCELDPKAPWSGDKGFPKAEDLREAIRYAVEQREAEVERRLAEAESRPRGMRLV